MLSYIDEADKILELVRKKNLIQAIKNMRTVTFDSLKICKPVVKLIEDANDSVDSVGYSELAFYLRVRRLTGGSCHDSPRCYNLNVKEARAEAVDHIAIIRSYAVAETVVLTAWQIICKNTDKFEGRIIVELPSGGGYQINIM